MIDLIPYFVRFGLIFFLFSLLLVVFAHFKLSYGYWKRKGVPYLEPKIPYGNLSTVIYKFQGFGGEAKNWYDTIKRAGHGFGGVWSVTRKVLVLVDPEYIKDVLTKDSQQFLNRDTYSNKKHAPRNLHLFNATEEDWKPLRAKLTPALTSAKIKMMLHSVAECSKSMVRFVDQCAVNKDTFNVREVVSSFTTDVIASVAFGLDCDSFDKTKHNDFIQAGKDFFNLTLEKKLKWFLIKMNPEFARAIGLSHISCNVTDFFTSVVAKTVEYRRKNSIRRPDFIQLLIDMHEEDPASPKYLNFDQVVANSIMFFVAGFDTSSATMGMALYELANNQELQEKTRQEINRVLKKYNGEITYDSLKDMTYLKQVIDESQRKWPPLLSLARICTSDYKLRDTDIVLDKGTPVVISTLGLGRDPEHYPEPERFDPDRFSPENKTSRHPYTHLPFGEGPRNCIGLRFGLMQSKIGIAQIIRNFKLGVSPKTTLPVEIEPTVLLLKTKNPIYLTPIQVGVAN